jgi:hypothetical protein
MMNLIEDDLARHEDKAGILGSTMGIHATMTAITSVAAVLLFVSVAVWEIT